MLQKQIQIEILKKEPRISTKEIAEWTSGSHRSIYILVSEYKEDLKEFGQILQRTRNYTNTAKETKDKLINSSGEKIEYLLNESQAALLLTYMKNTPIIRAFKIKLVKEFFRLRESLTQLNQMRTTQEWVETRSEKKIDRVNETLAIKRFAEYAQAQGSKNYNKYYMILTKMENETLYDIAHKFPNLRDVLSRKQLTQLAVADNVVEKALEDGMNASMNYKDVYQLAKSRLISYSILVGRTTPINQMLLEAEKPLLEAEAKEELS